MHWSRTLGIRLTAVAAALTGLLMLPVAAQADDDCTVLVTLANGKQLSFDVKVPAGTPLASIDLPVTGTVIGRSESCASSTPASAGAATDTTATTSSAAATTITGATTPTGTTDPAAAAPTTDSSASPTPATPAAPVAPAAPAAPVTGTVTSAGSPSPAQPVVGPVSQTQIPTGTVTGTSPETVTGTGTGTGTTPSPTPSSLLAPLLGVSLEAPPASRAKRATSLDTTPASTLTTAGGAPSTANPTYSFALPGAAAVGVPNFFIDSFQIPPFLLPIYQAAGIEYNVPWQVLAAINWIETDYGRDLSVSSAGAVGWMQFLPSTWKRWGVDATGSGYADPDNPTDAIFTAARYLSAAGASRSLSRAIFSYNHAGWYVQSVLLRAQLIGGMPADLISSLTNLVEGHFPVAAAATYADDSVVRRAGEKIKGTNAAIPVDSGTAQGTNIYAKAGAPVIAVNDGKIVGLGHSARLGRYIKLQDDEGNTYTYAHLAAIPKLYPVPKPVHTTPKELAEEVSGTRRSPAAPASAGLQPDSTLTVSTTTVPVAVGPRRHARQKLTSLATVTLTRAGAKPRAAAKPGASRAASVGSVAKERLFAHPTRPASFDAGGEQQLESGDGAITNFRDYFSDVLHLARNQYTLAPLTRGSIVVAGTVLGHVGTARKHQAPHVYFQIQPASSRSIYIDPKPILDGWKLLEATSIYRASGLNPFLSSGRQATIGQILLESKSQLQEQVLRDPRVSVYQCGRRDIQSGAIDRRILATMEFLAASGLDPTISGLKCGAGSHGIDTAGQTGASMDISAINNIPVAGHDGSGSITDITIRRLLTLQGAMSPAEVISGLSYKGQSNTLALPDHRNRIQVTFTPRFGANRKLSREVTSILKPNQWAQLIHRISEIPEPSVPTGRSASAVRTRTQ